MSESTQVRDGRHCPKCGSSVGFIRTVVMAVRERSLTCGQCGARLWYSTLPSRVALGLALLGVVLIVGPIIGGLLGGITYDALIRRYLPRLPAHSVSSTSRSTDIE